MTTLGKRVRAERRARNLTQAALADQVNISPTFLHQIETDRSNPSGKVLLMISDALGVSVQQLLTGEAGSAGEKDPVSIPPSLSKMADAHGLKHRTVLILAEVMAQIEDRCGKRDPIEPHEWYRIYHALQPIIEGGK